ncbi:hypothetical protein SOVF_200280 isoform B [Spinacia oleracea]|nr:hypothetical protein SOVF_200280 isoform B [Spinacia oleracea]
MKNSAVSKAELKMALVTKRLAMLQDHHEIVPVLSQVSPLQVLPNESHPLQCESAKLLMDPSDDTLSEDVLIPKSSKNRIKFGSHKRARIISDDESYEDEEHMVSVPPPRKKGRTKQKMIKINDPSNDENVAIDNPRRQKRMDLIEPSSMGEKSSSMKRPEEVQANLAAESPSFIKPMLKSHVSGGFWLLFPKKRGPDPAHDFVLVPSQAFSCRLGRASGQPGPRPSLDSIKRVCRGTSVTIIYQFVTVQLYWWMKLERNSTQFIYLEKQV